MRRLCYASHSHHHLGHPSDMEILTVAQQRNNALGITGALLRAPNQFFQILEGPEQALRPLVNRIMLDSRHSDLRVLSDRAVSARIFPDWTMGYAPISADLCTELTSLAATALDRLLDRLGAIRIVVTEPLP